MQLLYTYDIFVCLTVKEYVLIPTKCTQMKKKILQKDKMNELNRLHVPIFLSNKLIHKKIAILLLLLPYLWTYLSAIFRITQMF